MSFLFASIVFYVALAHATTKNTSKIIIFGKNECSRVNTSDFSLPENMSGLNVTLMLVFSAHGSTNMELFSAARELTSVYNEKHASDADQHAYLTALIIDCTSKKVGVAFTDFIVGMDCGVKRINRLMSSIDALKHSEAFTIKLIYLIQNLRPWHAERACAVWGDDVIRASLFWLLIASAYAAYRLIGHQKNQ